MTFAKDIIRKIDKEFADKADQAKEMISAAIATTDSIRNDRVIRCILFLSNGDLTDLTNYIESATTDVRDVIFWAEYTGLGESKRPRRIRDFNNTFDKCTDDVRD